ncbi:hypothetical protein VNO77_19688 [Canavalia gladiata]|uniref:Uncharacterized protein n=1 Tax=Canavalia gladiata TaxID=3824 RepID=A0AAN9LMZ6_CANGL
MQIYPFGLNNSQYIIHVDLSGGCRCHVKTFVAFYCVIYPCLVLQYMRRAAFLSKNLSAVPISFYASIPECGSFSSYIWGYVNHKPTLNRYPKVEALSKDLVKRGFRFVGPVIVHSFMQATGLTIDHLVLILEKNASITLTLVAWIGVLLGGSSFVINP